MLHGRSQTYRDNTVHLQVDHPRINKRHHCKESGTQIQVIYTGINMASKKVILVAIDKSEQSEEAFKCEYSVSVL